MPTLPGQVERSEIMELMGETELKYYNGELDALVITPRLVDTTDTLIKVVRGTGPATRIGRSITCKSMEMTGFVTLDPSTSFLWDWNMVDIYFVIDHQANGAYPSYSNIFQHDAHWAFATMSGLERFEVMAHSEMNFQPPAGAAFKGDGSFSESVLTHQTKRFNFLIPLNDLEITYAGADGIFDERTIVNMFIVVGYHGVGPVGGMTISYRSRLTYTDK